MKYITVIISLLLLVSQLFAQQTFEWGVKAGGSNTDIINDIITLGNDTYITGRFNGSMVSGSQNAEGAANNDIYLIRLNPKGGTKWLQTLSGEGFNNASRLAVGDKQILMGGTISETVKQGKKEFAGEGKAVFVSSWSEQGKADWLTRLNYTGHATLDVLEVNPDGSFLAGGLLQGTMEINGEELKNLNAKRAWVATFSAEGQLENAKLSFGEGHHRLVSATTDKQGNQYCLFSVNGHFSMEKDSIIELPKHAKNALVLTKLSQSGESEWTQSITGSAYVEGVKVISNEESGVLVCSNFNKELQAGEIRYNTNSQLESAIFCYTDKGKLEWSKTISSPVKARVMDVLIAGNGNILVSGYFRQSYVFNQEEFFSESSRGDLFLLQFSTKGELVWHDEPGQGAASFCKAFTLDQTGNIILAGGFKGELSFQDKKLKSAGKEDVLVAKYFNCLQNEATITGEEPICDGKEITLTVTGAYQTYIWNNSEWGNTNYVVNSPGTYHVTAYDAKGCAASDTVEIQEATEMGLGLPESIELNEGDETLLRATAGFSKYSWSEGTDGAEYTVSYIPHLDSLKISLSAETFEGCLATDSLVAYFNHNTGANSGRMLNAVVRAWPNPVETELMWSAKIEKPQEVRITLTDGKSINVSTQTIKRYIPGSVQTINMANLAGGNYLLSIRVGETVYNQKIVKR